MKKKFLILLLVLTFLKCFGSENKSEPSFFIEPNLSLSFENHGEYLLYASKEPASYLEWKLFPIVRSGIKTGLDINRFVMDMELTTAIPQTYGKMYDSDWNENGLKYIYSENDAKLLSDFSGQLALYYRFPFSRFELSPSICLRYDTQSFKAYNGYGWYGNKNYSKNGKDVPWDDSNAKYYPHIGGYSSYIVSSFYTFIGCTWKIKIAQKSVFGVGTYISPYSYTYTKDFHYRKSGAIKKYVYAQQQSFFYRFKEDLFFSFKLSDEIDLDSELSAILGGKAYGEYNFYQESTFEKEKYYLSSKGTSASDIYSVTAKIGISFNF